MSTAIDDLEFPKTVLTRLIKAGLPDNIAIQKEARQAVARAATVFVSYLAATANDCAREAGHKTIATSDVTKALEAVGLGDFVDRLMADLEAHTQLANDKKLTAAKHKAASDDGDEEQEAQEDEEDEEEDDGVDIEEASQPEPDSLEPVVLIDMPPSEDPMDVDDSDGEDAKRMRTE
ncbi:Protein heterodimerization activity protein [Coemansia spiralis]|nr:Protein heterodimerization activity protein [Coemansia spiralis]